TQSRHPNSRADPLRHPPEETPRLAQRTQQVHPHEAGVADVIDPLGGAPYIEALTDDLERRALELMAEVERRGGAVQAIEQGFVQREIHKSAMAWQRDVESKARTIVGVNEFTQA
ncbi:MAG: methylmalonyl-CoA mutase family protein, partial [bacterium]